jgi:hypothetical protein
MRDLLEVKQSIPAGSIFHPGRPEFLAFVWLHWTVVNATGLGSFALIMPRLVNIYGDLGLHLLLLIAGCLIVFALQGVVLRGAGFLAQGWVACQCLATAFGMVFALPFLCLAPGLPGFHWIMIFSSLGALFCLGASMGFVQVGFLNLTPEKEVSWWLWNGLGMSAAGGVVYLVAALLGAHLSQLNCPASLVATLAGGTYGIVSGWGVVQTLRRQNSLWQAMNAGKS